MAVSTLPMLAGMATVMGLIITVGGLAYKYGQARQDRQQTHEELESNFQSVKSDLNGMDEKIDELMDQHRESRKRQEKIIHDVGEIANQTGVDESDLKIGND